MLLTSAFAKTLNALGVHPTGLFNEQLRAAVDGDNALAVKRILTAHPEEAKSLRTMFEYAVTQWKFNAAFNMIEVVPEVLKKDYSAGEDFINRSILMQRTLLGREDEVEFLIERHADVNAKDDNGDTALHFGAGTGKYHSIKALVKAGAAVNAANKNGETPLMQATRGDSDKITRQLLGHGADIAVCDSKGLNATMHAIYNQNIKAAQFLMEQGGKVLDQNDPAVARIRNVATNEAEWDFIRLLNSQYDIERNRQDALAKMSIKEICETGIADDIKVRKPLQLKK